jgi:Cu(I)/Ag(I) efflux system membrane protein CusA/SilA
VLRPLWPDRIGREQLVTELDAALRVPGLTNTWTMPIKGRLEMLDSGLRAPLGLKVSGPEAAQTERLAAQVAEALKSLPGTRSVFAERNGLGRYLDIRWRRDALAHAGIRLQDAQETLATAIGGEMTSNPLVRKLTFTGSTLRPRPPAEKARLAQQLRTVGVGRDDEIDDDERRRLAQASTSKVYLKL